MSQLLYVYPGVQTVQCMSDPEHRLAEHWLTFWMASYVLEQIPLPWFLSSPALALMYLPDTTSFIRERMIYPLGDVINENIPYVKQKAFALLEKYRPQNGNNNVAWWKFW